MAGEAIELSSSTGINGSTHAQALLDITHFNYPWILLVIFLAAFVTNSILSAEPSSATVESIVTGPGGKPLPPSAKKSKAAKEEKKLEDFSQGRKLLFIWLSAGVIITFVANATNIVVHALTKRENGWWCGEATAIYVCASAFFYSIFMISLVDSASSPNIAHQLTWVIALIGEVILLGTSISVYSSLHNGNSLRKGNEDFRKTATQWEILEVVIDGVRVIIFVFLIAFYTVFSLERSYKNRDWSRRTSGQPDETAPLLLNGRANGHGHVDGQGAIETGTTPVRTTQDLENGGSEQTATSVGVSEEGNAAKVDANGRATAGRKSLDEAPAFYKPTTAPNRTWWEYLKGYSLFFPYLWPGKSLRLQIIVILCFVLALLQRAVNIAVPMQIGKVTNELSSKDAVSKGMPWLSISLLIAFKTLQGSSGILGAARSILWIPISQYSYQALTTASFEHVHSLSLDFHLGKRTGEVLSALSKGNAINNFLEQITFSVLPMIFDLGAAIVYFGIAFDAYYALVVSMITFSYLYLTIRMARWRSEQRRQMTNLSREEDAVKNDSLTSYETVKYFNAESYEFNRYRNAVTAFQKMEYQVIVSLNVLNISQNMVFMTGLLATSFIAAYQVTTGVREVGDFVILLTYMAQLQSPLNFFGTFYRSVQSAMISGERLLELFKEQPTVTDDSSAVPMPACEGAIRFQDVKFSYDKRKPALENLSFTCRPGTTTAFVGESGGGKSTVFRLLFRFYNTQDGSIQVDGKDIKDITIDSLRSYIGVVPQDTILFNETLMYNLRYANQDATDEDIHNACRAASIHDKILAFPDGYNTKVGERGLRLSGGEKQRVAIARTIIKNPRIIMLDEATAALDSETEQNIQEALMTLSEGRTMLVIAHRLSTVTSADQILVLHAGKVAEAGTHHELLAMKGRYASMWRKQIRAERASLAASKMVEKANALQKAALERPGSSGNEEGASGDVSENEADNRSSTTLAASLSTKAIRATESLRTDVSTTEETLMLEDRKSADMDGDQARSVDGNPDVATSSTADDTAEVEEGEPTRAEADDSKTTDQS